jgi:hypothetical protein
MKNIEQEVPEAHAETAASDAFPQNNQFKKCIQGTSPQNSTLQGANHKKKITGGKTKHAYITGGISLFTLKLYFCECFNGHLLQSEGYESLVCVRKCYNFKHVSQVVL